MLNVSIGFIGTGFMASAMIDGIVSSGICAPDKIYAINEAFPESAEEVSERFGIVHGSPCDLDACDVIVFGVKPQVFPEALEMYRERLGSDKLYLSIMAGISTKTLEDSLNGARVVRLMPNMPLSVGASATAYALGSHATEDDASVTEAIFEPLGLVARVTEDKMSKVTALSGSGPAYFCRLTEAMITSAVEMGLDGDTARALAMQTLIGTAKTLEKTGLTAEELRVRITSKKGTTEAALNAMTETDFDGSVKAALYAAARRSDELGS